MARSIARRQLLAGGAAAALAPAIVRAEAQTTLRFIPEIDLSVLDPISTSVTITRNHAFMVFDTLYGVGSDYQASPQMVEGHSVENDGKLWSLKLRDGLAFHDGEPVLARDCVASIRRWAKKDALGEALMAATDELVAADDRTLRFRLQRPFPLLPYALGKYTVATPVIMPERLANTDPAVPVTEMVGSGPFRFQADERVPGVRNVYVRNDRYVPRQGGSPDWSAGPKIVHFDRVVWTTIPDNATQIAAMQAGEQDWLNIINLDLLDLAKGARNLVVELTDPSGVCMLLRPNALNPPFDNPEARRALLHAIDQTDVMRSMAGEDTSLYHVPAYAFAPGSPSDSDVGTEALNGPRDYAKAKALLKSAGYNGEKIVMLVAEDYFTSRAMGAVVGDVLQKIGMNVETAVSDWGTMLARRAKKAPVAKGGWSVFNTGFPGTDSLNPANYTPLRGNGDSASAWPGWPRIPRLEQLRSDWFVATDPTEQSRICREIQRVVFEEVPFVPLGQLFQPTVYSKSLTGMNRGFPTFWNIHRAI